MEQRTVLVVDDELINLDNLTSALMKFDKNFKVFRANSAEMALEILAEKIPDVILTDWDMPGMDGIALIKEIKTKSSLIDVPIIMCTGIMTTSQHLKTALEAGAIDFIKKPIDEVELEARLQSVLKLSCSYKKIKELNSTKDKFISILAHDLKNPFHAILGSGHLLLAHFTELNEKEIKESVETIYNLSEKTYTLLVNLLEWARAQQDKISFSTCKMNLHTATLDTIIALSDVAQEKNIDIEVEVPDDLYISADVEMVKMILRNLISNAVKYTPGGGNVTISAAAENSKVEVTVRDTGVGMSDEKIDSLFRIDQAKSEKGTEGEVGTGFGLLLCKEFVEKHGGKIWVSSEVGKGSSFSFSFPQQ